MEVPIDNRYKLFDSKTIAMNTGRAIGHLKLLPEFPHLRAGFSFKDRNLFCLKITQLQRQNSNMKCLGFVRKRSMANFCYLDASALASLIGIIAGLFHCGHQWSATTFNKDMFKRWESTFLQTPFKRVLGQVIKESRRRSFSRKAPCSVDLWISSSSPSSDISPRNDSKEEGLSKNPTFAWDWQACIRPWPFKPKKNLWVKVACWNCCWNLFA